MISWRIEIEILEILKVIAFTAVCYCTFFYKSILETSWFLIHFDFLLFYFSIWEFPCLLAWYWAIQTVQDYRDRLYNEAACFGFGFGGEHASSNQNSAFFWFPNPTFVDLPVDVDVKTTTSWGPEEEERAAPVSSEKPRDAADASSWGISERNPGCGCQVNTTRSPKALFNWCIKLWIVVTKLGCFTISIHSILEFSGSGSRCLAWLRGVLHHNKLTSLKLLKRCGVSGSW